MRSVLRWLRRLVAGAVLLAAVVTAVALVAAHTDGGREQLRAYVEAALQDAFPGGARVRAVEGSILGTLIARDVELDGHDHTPIVTIGTLRVTVALWPLVVQTAHIDALVAEDVHVFVHDRPPPASGARSASGPSPWRVELPHVEIWGAAIEIEVGGSRQLLTDLDAAGAVMITPAGDTTMFGRVHGQWSRSGATPAPAAELTAMATVVLGGRVHVPAAVIVLRGTTHLAQGVAPPSGAVATISATDLVIDAEHPSGRIAVSAPARVVTTLIPELEDAGVSPDRLGDVAATIAVAAVTTATTRVEIHAAAGETTLRATLLGELAAQAARGEISAHGVDLALLTRGRVGGRGDLFAAGTGHRTDSTVFIEVPRLVATSSGVDVLDQRITGRLVVNAQATGTLAPALAVDLNGKMTGEGVTFADAAIATVTGPFELHVGPGARRGEAHVTATGIRNAGTRLGTAHADIERHADGTFGVAATAWPPTKGLEISANALVTLGEPGKPTVARLDRTRVRLPDGRRWAGRGGSVVLTEAKVAMRDVTLHDGEATVALRGDFARSTGVLVAHASADRFPASAIDARYRGLGSGRLALTRRGGVWQADGRFNVLGFAVAAEATPIDGNAHVVLAHRHVTLDANATSPELGDVGLAFEAVAPRDPFDVSAWRALDRSAVRNATITARKVALSGVLGIAGPSASGTQLTGTIDGEVNLAPAELRGTFNVRDVELPFGTLDGDLAFAPHDGDLGATATVGLSGISADVTARFAVPERPFDPATWPATWQHRGRAFLKEAAVDLDEVALDPELLARLGVTKLLAGHGVTAPLRGRATVALALGDAARQARLAIDLNDVTGGPLVEPISSHVAISAGPDGTHLRAALLGHGVGLGVLEATTPMTVDRWIAEPATVRRAPITADWTLPVTPAKRLLAVVGRHDLAGGSLEGGATIRGPLATPIVESARLVARDLEVAAPRGGYPPPAFAELEAVGTWDGASGSVTITGRQATGGTLHAVANGRPDALAAATGSITTEHFDVTPIAAWLPSFAPGLRAELASLAGIVDANLTLRTGGQLTGELHLIGGGLPIAAAGGTLREATADVAINERTITATIDGKLGHGTVQLSTEATPDLATIKLRELRLENVSVLGGSRPILHATLRTAGNQALHLERGQLRGGVTVQDARITVPGHAGPPLLDATAPPDLVFKGAPEAGAAPGPRAPASPWLVVDVALGATRIDAPDAIDSAGLGVKGTVGSDKLTVSIGGTVDVRGTIAVDNAYVEFLGRRYQLDGSKVNDLRFDGTTDPRLAIYMTHAFPELTLHVDVRGRASHPDLQFSSEPGTYSQGQLLGFLVGGEPGGDPDRQAGEAFKGALARWFSSRLGRQVNKVLPIKVDALSCEPSTTATSASCTVGKWLSQRLFLAYRQHLEPLLDENANDVHVRYRLGRKVLIEGTGGDRGHHGADLLWRHRW
jgi:translocation and assembly module TamB